MGIEPTLFAWEAKVLPLNYTRVAYLLSFNDFDSLKMKVAVILPLHHGRSQI